MDWLNVLTQVIVTTATYQVKVSQVSSKPNILTVCYCLIWLPYIRSHWFQWVSNWKQSLAENCENALNLNFRHLQHYFVAWSDLVRFPKPLSQGTWPDLRFTHIHQVWWDVTSLSAYRCIWAERVCIQDYVLALKFAMYANNKKVSNSLQSIKYKYENNCCNLAPPSCNIGARDLSNNSLQRSHVFW